jgi:uncharacterized Fe-S cluster protein YjdI|tara:strand:+ start:323 stop:502 length:180 start_codon:yes stop_codon:yes gene_type:complete
MKVKWDDKICIHAGECVKNLPSVFKVVDEKFVIDESGASEDEVKRVVGLCPSGALKVED